MKEHGGSPDKDRFSRLNPASQSVDTEKRIRREIANSNERRRMQSINTGFNSLRTMLPKHDGEKLSKAAILQHTAEYIDTLEHEKTRLLAQHCQLKRVIASMLNGQPQDIDQADQQMVKRIKTEHVESANSDSSDEGIQCHPSPGLQISEGEANVDEMRNELVEIRKTVDRERKLRMQLEDQVRMLESQLYPERVKEIAQQVSVKYCEGVSSLVNSESEDTAAVASLVDDEVIAETIEIETHSCPGSPTGQPTTIVISAPSTSGTPQLTTITSSDSQNTSRIVQCVESIDVSRIPKTSSKAQQPAAIALPIDMPFTGTGGQCNNVTIQIIGSANEQTVNMSNTSRHNLETIVEAIRHLEGDHLFKDEEAVTVSVKEEYDGEEIITSGIEEVELQTSEPTTSTKSVKQTLTPVRQQVICMPVTNSQSRPGVIVAKNQ